MEAMLDTFVFETSSLLEELDDILMRTENDELLPDDIADDEEPDIGDLPPDVLTRMISRLPSGYRMVLNLYVFEHCPHKEIARQLGIKESTSASQLLRARKMLARMMKEYLKQQGI